MFSRLKKWVLDKATGFLMAPVAEAMMAIPIVNRGVANVDQFVARVHANPWTRWGIRTLIALEIVVPEALTVGGATIPELLANGGAVLAASAASQFGSISRGEAPKTPLAGKTRDFLVQVTGRQTAGLGLDRRLEATGADAPRPPRVPYGPDAGLPAYGVRPADSVYLQPVTPPVPFPFHPPPASHTPPVTSAVNMPVLTRIVNAVVSATSSVTRGSGPTMTGPRLLRQHSYLSTGVVVIKPATRSPIICQPGARFTMDDAGWQRDGEMTDVSIRARGAGTSAGSTRFFGRITIEPDVGGSAVVEGELYVATAGAMVDAPFGRGGGDHSAGRGGGGYPEGFV